jgi:hypothetical protein
MVLGFKIGYRKTELSELKVTNLHEFNLIFNLIMNVILFHSCRRQISLSVLFQSWLSYWTLQSSG